MDPTVRTRLIEVGARAIYEEPYTYCEACNGVGQDENVCFWCSACKGEGHIVDEDNVPAAKEYAELIAAAVVDALGIEFLPWGNGRDEEMPFLLYRVRAGEGEQ